LAVDAGTKRNMRGAILKLIYQKHERQETRFRDKTLLAALDKLAFHVYLNLVHELLQNLSDSGLVKYKEDEDGTTGELTISQIQLTPRGRSIVERAETDSSVNV
jgi:hypothetical protein